MKKTLLFFGMVVFSAFISAQTTIFSETFGTTNATRGTCTSVAIPGTAETGKYDPLKNEQYTDHDWTSNSHVWNSGIAYSQTSATTTRACDDAGTTLNIRADNPSSLVNASGDGNLYFNANTTNSFTISGINTLNFKNITLSFEIYGKNKADVNQLKLQYDNGSGFTDIGQNQIGSLNQTKATWLQIDDIILPAGSNLSLKISTPNTNPQNANASVEISIDDIKIVGTAISSWRSNEIGNNQKVVVSNSTITLEGFTNGDIEIYTFQGKRVFISEFKDTIQPQLARGLYIIRIGNFRQKISW